MCICHLKCFCSSSVFMSLFLSLSVHYYVNYILIFIVMWVRYPIRGCEKDSRFLGLVIERGHIYIQSRHFHGEYTESIQSTSSHVHSKLIALLHQLTVSLNQLTIHLIPNFSISCCIKLLVSQFHSFSLPKKEWERERGDHFQYS